MNEFVEDGVGGKWYKCGAGCHLEVLRPGKVQCLCDEDSDVLIAHSTENTIDGASLRCYYCHPSAGLNINHYGYCDDCGFRAGVACKCGMTFAEKIKTVGIDKEALRIFNMGGKGRKRGKDSSDNKRGA